MPLRLSAPKPSARCSLSSNAQPPMQPSVTPLLNQKRISTMTPLLNQKRVSTNPGGNLWQQQIQRLSVLPGRGPPILAGAGSQLQPRLMAKYRMSTLPEETDARDAHTMLQMLSTSVDVASNGTRPSVFASQGPAFSAHEDHSPPGEDAATSVSNVRPSFFAGATSFFASLRQNPLEESVGQAEVEAGAPSRSGPRLVVPQPLLGGAWNRASVLSPARNRLSTFLSTTPVPTVSRPQKVVRPATIKEE